MGWAGFVLYFFWVTLDYWVGGWWSLYTFCMPWAAILTTLFKLPITKGSLKLSNLIARVLYGIYPDSRYRNHFY